MRIAIIGHSGSGKSTLAICLGDMYGLPVLHLDRVYFLPGWAVRGHNEALEIAAGFMRRDDWVIDGNYTNLLYEERLDMADTIIYMGFSRASCLCRVIKRYFKYKGAARESMAEGCAEKIDAEFIWWILHKGRTREKMRQYGEVRRRYAGKVVTIRNQGELDGYLGRLTTDMLKAR